MEEKHGITKEGLKERGTEKLKLVCPFNQSSHFVLTVKHYS